MIITIIVYMVIVVGGVPTSYEAIGLELDVPQCVSNLQSVTVSHSENCVTGYVITQKRRGRNG